MDRAASRSGMLDGLRSPRPAQPYPIIHRRRHKPEWVEDTQLRGKEFWKAIGMTVLATALLFFVWWYGGM